MANTTWSTTDRLNITLSGGNLVATVANTSTGGVRSIDSLASGKYYWEYTGTAFWAGQGMLVGVANAGAVLSSIAATVAGVAVVIGAAGNIYINSTSSSASLGGQSAGAVIGTALDLTNLAIWFRNAPSGNWNGSGTANPATNVGGFSISALGTPLYGLMGMNAGLTNAAITANFGDSAFSGGVPAGFTAGLPLGGSGGGAVTQARALIMA